jgi:hypothetical protein
MKAVRAALVSKRPQIIQPAVITPDEGPSLSFIYTTCRKDPKLKWFVDSLYNQVKEVGYNISKIQLIVVDFELQYDESRRTMVDSIIRKRFDYVHVPPKPSPWQGKFRLMSCNAFSASLSRNTGVCYAHHPYLFFIDDLCVLAPGSFSYMIDYAKQNIIVGFSYKKVHDLVVTDGTIVNVREVSRGIDTRYHLDMFTKLPGSSLFGYSASPLSVVLSVNGYDEICNSIAGEDYHYGIRVEKAGNEIYYSKHVLFYETEDTSEEVSFLRRDPLLTEEEYSELMKRFNIVKRWYPDGRTDVSHLVLDLLTRDKTWTEGNDYNLAELRKTIQNGDAFLNTFDQDIKTIEGVLLREL